jgi:hypothetical protein
MLSLALPRATQPATVTPGSGPSRSMEESALGRRRRTAPSARAAALITLIAGVVVPGGVANAQPRGLIAMPGNSAERGSVKIALMWSPVAGAAGYNVYRFAPNKPDSQFVFSGSDRKVNTALIKGTTFIEQDGTRFDSFYFVPGLPYWYRVKAVDRAGKEGPASDWAYARTPRTAGEQHDHGVGSKFHPKDPRAAREHAAILALVPVEKATSVAVRSGNWSDAGTWRDGAIPVAGSRVVIDYGVTVTVDGEFADATTRWLRVDGILQFDPAAPRTSLKVVTTIVSPQGRLELGTKSNRLAGVARYIIADRGRQGTASRLADPFDFSGGLISHGAVRMAGAEYTSHQKPIAIPQVGDTQAVFSAPPKGWKVGDQLLIAGTNQEWLVDRGKRGDEVREITAVSSDGRTFSWAQPLLRGHTPPTGYDGPLPVGNLSRNITFESEYQGRDDLTRRGHVMFMHSLDVQIDSVAFRELGRTDTKRHLTVPAIDGKGKPIAGTADNTVGRYPAHFHLEAAPAYDGRMVVMENCAISGSPKHGIVQHGLPGKLFNNVTYDVAGSHLFAENGAEVGIWAGNFMVYAEGSSNPFENRQATFDLGHEGNGTWPQGGIVTRDNLAIEMNGGAINFPIDFVKNESFATSSSGFPVFLARNLRDPSMVPHRPPYVGIHNVPGLSIGDVGLLSHFGLHTFGTFQFASMDPDPGRIVPTTIRDLLLAGNYTNDSSYTKHLHCQRCSFYAPASGNGAAIVGNSETEKDVEIQAPKLVGYTPDSFDSRMSVLDFVRPYIQINSPDYFEDVSGETLRVSFATGGEVGGMRGVAVQLDGGTPVRGLPLSGSTDFKNLAPGVHRLMLFMVGPDGRQVVETREGLLFNVVANGPDPTPKPTPSPATSTPPRATTTPVAPTPAMPTEAPVHQRHHR